MDSFYLSWADPMYLKWVESFYVDAAGATALETLLLTLLIALVAGAAVAMLRRRPVWRHRHA